MTPAVFSVSEFSKATGIPAAAVKKTIAALPEGATMATLAAALLNAHRSEPSPIPTGEASISELARLTGMDRATVRKRLEGVPPAKGNKNSAIYRLEIALPLLCARPDGDFDEARLRRAQADAQLTELKLKREQEEVIDVEEVRDYALRLFKALFNRIGVRFPREIATQLYKAESPAQITEILQRELGRIFNDLRDDHKAFL